MRCVTSADTRSSYGADASNPKISPVIRPESVPRIRVVLLRTQRQHARHVAEDQRLGAVADDRRQPVQQLGGHGSDYRTSAAVYVVAVAEDFDIEASGLLDGLEGKARDERAELIPWLLERGITVEQIRGAFVPALLAARKILGDDGTYVSARETSEKTGIDLDVLQRIQRAMGLPTVDDPDAASTCARTPRPRRLRKSSSSSASTPIRSCRSPGCSPRACHAPQK